MKAIADLEEILKLMDKFEYNGKLPAEYDDLCLVKQCMEKAYLKVWEALDFLKEQQQEEKA